MLVNPPPQPPQLLEDLMACTPRRPTWWHGGTLPPILGKGPPRSAVSLLVNGNLTVLTQSQSHTSGAGRESRYIHDHWGANGQDPIDPSLYTPVCSVPPRKQLLQ